MIGVVSRQGYLATDDTHCDPRRFCMPPKSSAPAQVRTGATGR
jgi:hypothetical protein